MNPLYDEDFLKKLDRSKEKDVYARITSLTWNEDPVEYIEGKIISGSISIDGTSAIQRTCSLGLVSEKLDINDFYWYLKSKFKLEVGLKNTIDKKYPDIIWFNQGIYVLISFNISLSASGYSINLSGKDKMCLLNGELGGSLPSSVDFGSIEKYSEEIKDYIIEKVPIKTILKQALHTYGNEPYHNIFINDVDDYGVELLEYRGNEESPLFLFRNSDFGYVNMSLKQDKTCYIEVSPGEWLDQIPGHQEPLTIGKIEEYGYKYDNLVELINGVPIDSIKGTPIKLSLKEDSQTYTIARIEQGQTAGYRLTELIYPEDLICNIGEPLTAMLDKIKAMLGDFEYFYDLNGRFVFQRTKTYLSNPWNTIKREGEKENNDDLYVESSAFTSAYSYTFHDNFLFSSISSSPQLSNIKNDYSLWGAKQGINGDKIPIHSRYALDYKPVEYTNLNGEKFSDEVYDWRELIYQMAQDYYNHNQEDDFLFRVAENNKEYYPTGYTGYEKYYTDILGFWRELYYLPKLAWDVKNIENTKNPIINVQYYIKENGWYKKQDFKDIAGLKTPSESTNYYIKNEDGVIGQEPNKLSEFDKSKQYFIKDENNDFVEINIYRYLDNNIDYYIIDDENYDYDTFYNKDINNDPGNLKFWFDFIGEGSEVEKFFISSIGDRSKSIDDEQITGIYFKQVPTVLFITPEEWNSLGGQPTQTGYTYIQINDTLNSFFNISSQGKSAHDVMEEMMYQHTYMNDTINISMIPVYYLQPNTRISVKDKDSGIDGEYIISRINLSLAYNGMMSITASRVPEKIY